MLIPKYWAKASKEVVFPKGLLSPSKTGIIYCWRWSNQSETEAHERAVEAINRRAASLAEENGANLIILKSPYVKKSLKRSEIPTAI